MRLKAYIRLQLDPAFILRQARYDPATVGSPALSVCSPAVYGLSLPTSRDGVLSASARRAQPDKPPMSSRTSLRVRSRRPAKRTSRSSPWRSSAPSGIDDMRCGDFCQRSAVTSQQMQRLAAFPRIRAADTCASTGARSAIALHDVTVESARCASQAFGSSLADSFGMTTRVFVRCTLRAGALSAP